MWNGPGLREILTIIAALLVAALTAALAIPPLVDWDAQRARIAARLSDTLEGKVDVAGPVSLRLLPAPRLTVGALTLARPGLSLRSRAAAFELSPAALLRGKFDFTDISLEGPDVALAPADFAPSTVDGARVGVDRLNVRDATLHIAGANPLTLDHVDATGSLDTLAGPFRASGVWRDRAFSFSTSAIEGRKLRVKFAIDAPVAAAIHGESEGEIAFADGAPAFTGKAVVTHVAREADIPWRASFVLRADAGGAHAEDMQAQIGDDDHALTATGAADLPADGALAISLSARNLDLDRFRAGLFAPARGPDVPVAFTLKAESATLGGETLTAPQLALRMAPGAVAQVELDAGLPGRVHLHYAGALDLAARAIDGDARFDLRDPRTFARWIEPVAPQAARLVGAAVFAQTSVAAHVRADANAASISALDATLDRTRIGGAVDWSAPREGVRAKISANLTSPALDIDGLPQLDAFGALDPSGVDVALVLDAQAIKVARVGKTSANAGRIRLRLSRDADSLSLDELSIEDLGGASLTGAGRFGARGGGVDLKLDAERLGDLATLVARVAPSAASEAMNAGSEFCVGARK